MGVLQSIGKFLTGSYADEENSLPVEDQLARYLIDVDSLPAAFGGGSQNAYLNDFTGDKFAGGFGDTRLYNLDYWTLRRRSSQLFTENPYARGLIRRLITNEINTGLSLVCAPIEDLLSADDDTVTQWAETVEARFGVYAGDKNRVDFLGEQTFGGLQRIIRRESLIDGDILVVLRQDEATTLPQVRLIRGEYVVTPIGSPVQIKNGNRISYGVELDPEGRQVAYWVVTEDGYERIPTVGPKSGRRLAWLVYGNDRRHGEVRGEPLLSLLLQSLKEIDRYRDSAQRKAVVNSLLAMFIKKTDDKAGTKPFAAGAIRRDAVELQDGAGTQRRRLNIDMHQPGMVFDELQTGEEPVAFRPDGTDLNFPAFEAAIINVIAWVNEMPAEILTLGFSHNYSASQAAINEFKIYLHKIRTEFAEQFNVPFFKEWIVSELLRGKLTNREVLQSWRNPASYDLFNAWVHSEWTGAIKPSTDIVKQTRGMKEMVSNGWTTNENASRELTGTKFRSNVRRIRRENELLTEAMAPIMEMQERLKAAGVGPEALTKIQDLVHDALEAVLNDSERGAA